MSAICPVSAISHPERGSIWLRVNDELRQQGDLSQQIWKVPETIAFLSTLVELRPGDLIMTGTPRGSARCAEATGCGTHRWSRRPRGQLQGVTRSATQEGVAGGSATNRCALPPRFSRKSPHRLRAAERTRTAHLLQLRVICAVLRGYAQACRLPIFRRFLFPALRCTVLRSRWCQSGVNFSLVLA